MEQLYEPACKSVSPQAPPAHAASATESGVIVFSSPTRILYMNGQAKSLMALFGETRDPWSIPANESMPSILTEMCDQVMEQLRCRIEAQDWTQFEMRRICHMVTPPLLLRGFGIPDSAGEHPHLVLTIQKLIPSEQSSGPEALPPTRREPIVSSSHAIL